MDLEKVTGSEKKYLVYCACGQHYPVVNPEMHPYMDCGVCGRQIKITPENTIPADETDTALYKRVKNLPHSDRIAESIRLIQAGKSGLAKPILLSIMKDLIPIKEAFYCLGYCYYKEQKYLESFIYMGIAVMLGHQSAKGLFQKLKDALCLGDTNFKSKFE